MSYRYFFRFQSWQRGEEKRVQDLFYHHPLFAKVDRALKRAYWLKNPYRMLKSSPYGETPLTTFQKILDEFQIPKEASLIDFGSGRGRIPLFLSTYHGMKAVGVESFSPFVAIANQIAANAALPTQFYCSDMEEWGDEPDFIYLYGTCLSDETIKKLVDKPWKRAQWITVSFPLSDYSSRFRVVKKLHGAYPWGDTEIFLNRS